MADSDFSGLPENTSPASADLLAMTDDPSGTPVTQKITLANLFKVINTFTADTSPQVTADYVPTYDNSGSAAKKVLLNHLAVLGLNEEGSMYNGRISPSVSSNNLTLALKTNAGTDPSSTDPVYVRIGNTARTITAALSTTLSAGTNWHGSGGTMFASKAIDYFVYLVYDSGSSAVGISHARIPYGHVVSDFSSTSTNENYLSAYSNYTTTDDCVLIGRFQATLSGTPNYNWSVPTYTSVTLINKPINWTRDLDFTPTWTNLTIGTQIAKYKITENWMEFNVNNVAPTISGAVSFAVPFTPVGYEASALYSPIGGSIYVDAGNAVYNGVTVLHTSSIEPRANGAGGTYGTLVTLSASIPFTWAASDTIDISGRYRIG